MKRFVDSKPAMLGVGIACGLALLATMIWTYTLGVSVERVIAMLAMAVGLVSAIVQLDRIGRGQPVD